MPPKTKPAPTLKPFKFLVQGVALRTDHTGTVLGEVTTEPVALYGVDALKEWADGFEANLAAAVEQAQT